MASSSSRILFLLPFLCLQASACFSRKPARITTLRSDWMPWTAWSACTKTCNGSYKWRVRKCRPGGDCESSSEKAMRDCESPPCPSNARDWSRWSDCSTSCGMGRRSRNRECIDKLKPCKTGESEICKLRECPIDGVWTLWTPWTSCSQTCGSGTATRSRFCRNPEPKHGGKDCSGSRTESRPCDLPLCHPKIVGQWEPWGDWGSCSVTCREGVKRRERRCNITLSADEGEACVGLKEETKPCVVAKYCHKPVNGQWSAWKEWNECNERCGKGTRTRLRFCNNPFPKYGGEQCPGKAVQSESCRDICVTDGQWSAWRPKDECSAGKKTCAKGWQHQSRACDNPAPKHGGRTCSGDALRTIECWVMRGCPESLQAPADFSSQSFENKTMFVSWREVPYGLSPTHFEIKFKRKGSPDSEAGTYTVNRIHSRADMPVDGRRYSSLVDLKTYNGPVTVWISAVRLEASKREQKSTKTHELLVGEIDGGWSAWDPWSACSKTCNEGITFRVRRCDSPTRTANGRPCVGEGRETKTCFEDFCLRS